MLHRDRATFDPHLTSAVNYTVASPVDAPDSLTFGPPFITLASQLKGQVTMGLNRQLNNQSASLAAAVLAQQKMPNLFAIELGNEPECLSFSMHQCRLTEPTLMRFDVIVWASTSPIIVAGGKAWNQDADAASEKSWFTAFSSSVSCFCRDYFSFVIENLRIHPR